MIYVLQAGPGGPIKIGYTGDPWRRLAQIQACNPTELQMLAAFEGHEGEEAELHRKFAPFHIRGEWFCPTDEILALASRGIAPRVKRATPRNTAKKIERNWSRDELIAAEHRAERLGVSIATLCRRAGIERTSWVYWKRGHVKPRPENWGKVLDALQTLELRREVMAA